MEVIEIPSTEFDRIVDEIEGNLKFLATFNTIKLFLANGLVGVEFKLFLCEQDGYRHYLAQQITLNSKLNIRHECDSDDQEFVRTSTLALLTFLQPTFDQFEGFMSVAMRDDIREVANEYFKKAQSHPFIAMDEPNWSFYLNPHQVHQLMNTSLTAPEGYEFSKLTEKDALEVCNDQLYTSKGDEKIIALKIAGLPSVSIIHKATKDLASYIIHDNFGMISLLYTRKEHRHKGIASLIEKRLNQIDVEHLGIVPFKAVSLNRPRVLEMSAKAYSTVKDSNGNEEICWWVYRAKSPRKEVVIYEN